MFMDELKKADLLMDGEVSIQQEGHDKPYVYRGFQMVDENKLRELRGDVLRKLMQNGILGLIFAHLFSLQLMREVFAEQVKRSEEHTSELQSLMRISYAVFCLKKKNRNIYINDLKQIQKYEN